MASETTKAIIKDIGDELFCILVDESRDVSIKEQMAVVLRYINKKGCVMERFLGISHVAETSALTLKVAIEAMLVKHGLSLSKIRGQGYDGASNMRGELNGLKTLILEENSAAYYVHCFAHQLQLTLVAVARHHEDVSEFFTTLSSLVNFITGSSKRMDVIRDHRAFVVGVGVSTGEIESGKGMNQETSLRKAGDTRWGSHFSSIVNLQTMFSSIIDSSDVVRHQGKYEAKGQAVTLLKLTQSFQFVFIMKMMIKVLSITNELSIALQRKDQDIINAMNLVRVAKQRLKTMKDNGWESLLEDVVSFCMKQHLAVVKMNGQCAFDGRSKHNVQEKTNLHYFQVELFHAVLDMQLEELNDRFDEVNTELLCCVSCLSPENSFEAFNKQRLVQLASFYPCEFSNAEIQFLELQLDNYIVDMQSDERFRDIDGRIAELSRKLVETKKHLVFPLVYLLVKLALILPVATASVERVFSSMSYIKNKYRNKMGDELLNDCMVAYIEGDELRNVDNRTIMGFFQNMKTRRCMLLKD